MADRCRVYWGSHGCDLPRGHEGHHVCDCCEHDTLADHIACEGVAFLPESDDGEPAGSYLCVATWPYYGPETQFYGEDAPPAPVTITVARELGGARAVCSTHGPLPFIWSDPRMVAYDALGHLAHHHRK